MAYCLMGFRGHHIQLKGRNPVWCPRNPESSYPVPTHLVSSAEPLASLIVYVSRGIEASPRIPKWAQMVLAESNFMSRRPPTSRGPGPPHQWRISLR
jgi:hypothetical protein